MNRVMVGKQKKVESQAFEKHGNVPHKRVIRGLRKWSGQRQCRLFGVAGIIIVFGIEIATNRLGPCVRPVSVMVDETRVTEQPQVCLKAVARSCSPLL